jgi:hypothetical protein
MGSKTSSNTAGQEYNQYTFTKDGYVADEATFRQFEEDHKTYKTTNFRTNDEDAQDEAGGGAPAGGSPDSKDDAY